MNFNLLFIVFLYIRGCNARVVPLDFKVDKSSPADPSVVENELFDKSPLDEAEILDQGLPDIDQSKDLDRLNSKEDNTTILEIPSRNTSHLPTDLKSKEKPIDEEPNLEHDESLAISDPLEELNSTSKIQLKFESVNSSDSEGSFETIQMSGTSNEKRTEDFTFKDVTSMIKNSLPDLEQNKMDIAEIEEKSINNEIKQNETSEVNNIKIKRFEVDSIDQNETFAAINSELNETFVAVNSDLNETFVAVNSDLNETFAAVNSDQNKTFADVHSDLNETLVVINRNNSNNFLDHQPLSNDTKVEVTLGENENITDEFKSNNSISESLEVTNDSINSDGGIFSGFEFLINSEVARNAAKAMEVFNFSDPLTDHIMEENEFHSFLPAFNAVESSSSPNQMDKDASSFLVNSSEESNARSNFTESFPSKNETSITLNQTNPEETKNDSSILLDMNKPLKEENKTESLDSAEKLKINTSSEVLSPLENSVEKVELASEATISEDNTQDLVSNSSAVIVPKCPSPGWCIFWFLSQDACAVSEHCLGNRICCKIGCSKTCIEVESSQ